MSLFALKPYALRTAISSFLEPLSVDARLAIPMSDTALGMNDYVFWPAGLELL